MNTNANITAVKLCLDHAADKTVHVFDINGKRVRFTYYPDCFTPIGSGRINTDVKTEVFQGYDGLLEAYAYAGHFMFACDQTDEVNMEAEALAVAQQYVDARSKGGMEFPDD